MTLFRTKFKKRHILFALVGLELVSLPVSAHIITNIETPTPSIVSFAEFPNEKAGESRFLVTANSPFAVVADSKFASYTVDITVKGKIGPQSFGENAQLPGMPKTCSSVRQNGPAVIYKSTRGTEMAEGSAPSRAVVVTVRYPSNLKPEFDIVSMEDARPVNNSMACQKLAS